MRPAGKKAPGGIVCRDGSGCRQDIEQAADVELKTDVVRQLLDEGAGDDPNVVGFENIPRQWFVVVLPVAGAGIVMRRNFSA